MKNYYRVMLGPKSVHAAHGAIVSVGDDRRIRHTLVVVPGIGSFRYQISFKLLRA